MMDDGKKILIIGPLPPMTPTDSNPPTGSAVNFLETVRQLQQRNIELDLVDTSRPRVNVGRCRLWCGNVMMVLGVLRRVVVRIGSCHLVFLNMSAPRAWIIGSAIWIICRVYRRPMALRFFGGDFAIAYYASGGLKRLWCDATYMRCDRVFVQTQKLLRRFSERPNVRWFPNTRDVRPPAVERSKTVRKLLFVGQLRLEKGLRETLEACRDLPSFCHLNLFGPQKPNVDVVRMTENHDRATYRGVLRSEDVPLVLSKHDVLVLPSYWEVEGYPGIIIESLQCGVPVISTEWSGIPEVVEHGRSGLLVTPRSASAVKCAIHRLIGDPELYQELCNGAQSRGEFFRSKVWYDRIVADLRRLCT